MPAYTERTEERAPAGQEGKVWQSDVVLLTSNIYPATETITD